MKSTLIKMLGLSLGCSCSTLQAQGNVSKEISDQDALILTSVLTDESTPSNLSSLQDISKIYAL